MKKLCLLFLTLFVFAFLLTSCIGGLPTTQNPNNPNTPTNPETPEEPEDGGDSKDEVPDKIIYYKVMVTLGEGFTVKSQNPIDVEKGTDAVFDIEIAETHAFLSTSAGEYDQTTGKLTVKKVTKRTTVTFKVEPIAEEEVGKSYVYAMYGTDKDTTSIASFSNLDAGTLVSVKAGDMTRNFVGWSFDRTLQNGGTIASTEREFEFRISADIADQTSFVAIYPNYSDANVFYYDLAGGTFSTSTVNMKANDYYTAQYVSGDRIKITLLDKYFKYAQCASTFWDDGSFTKSGYILREYNTKADGSGEAYSLGSKYFPVSENGGDAVLYCIWEKADEASLFESDNYTYEKPDTAITASLSHIKTLRLHVLCNVSAY